MEFTLTAQRWPDGTTVGVYDATGFSSFPAGGPPGSAVTSAEVSGASVTFSGLTDKTRYFAAAQVGGEWRAIGFTAGEDGTAAAVQTEDLGSGQLKVPGRDEAVDFATKAELDAVEGGGAKQSDLEALETQLDNLAIVNVKDHGAKGDGETDDAAAIKAALETFGNFGEKFDDIGSAAAGGILYFPPGTYLTSETIEIFPGLQIVGAGVGSSKVQATKESNIDLVRTTGFAELSEGSSSEGPFRFAIRDIWLSGGEGNTKGRGVAIYGRYYFIDRVQISGFAEAGLWSRWHPAGDQMEAKINDLKIIECGNAEEPALDWRGPHDSILRGVDVIRPNGTAIRTSEGTAAGTHFFGCHTWGVTEGHKVGWSLETGGTYLIACQGEGASECQLDIKADFCVVLGGHYFGLNEEGGGDISVRIGAEGSEVGDLYVMTRASKCEVGLEWVSTSNPSMIFAGTEPAPGGVDYKGTPSPHDHVVIRTGSDSTNFQQTPTTVQAVEAASEITLARGCDLFIVEGSPENEAEEPIPVEKINGGYAGRIVTLRREGENLTIKDGENLKLAGDWTGNWGDVLTLIHDGADWYEISRSAN